MDKYMQGLPNPFSGISSNLYFVIIILSVIVNLAGVLVALDARERGMSKVTAVLWFFAVIVFFGLPAAVYLLFRNSVLSGRNTSHTGTPQASDPSPPATAQRFCPYCGAPQQPHAKLCPDCGKFL